MAASVAKFTFGIIKLLCQVRSDDLEVIYVGTNPMDVELCEHLLAMRLHKNVPDIFMQYFLINIQEE